MTVFVCAVGAVYALRVLPIGQWSASWRVLVSLIAACLMAVLVHEADGHWQSDLAWDAVVQLACQQVLYDLTRGHISRGPLR